MVLYFLVPQMRINWFRAIGILNHMAGVLAQEGLEIPKGDTGLYVLLREACLQLESTNPGISQAAGYFTSMGDPDAI